MTNLSCGITVSSDRWGSFLFIWSMSYGMCWPSVTCSLVCQVNQFLFCLCRFLTVNRSLKYRSPFVAPWIVFTVQCNELLLFVCVFFSNWNGAGRHLRRTARVDDYCPQEWYTANKTCWLILSMLHAVACCHNTQPVQRNLSDFL